jgi:hypothetical protein
MVTTCYMRKKIAWDSIKCLLIKAFSDSVFYLLLLFFIPFFVSISSETRRKPAPVFLTGEELSEAFYR